MTPWLLILGGGSLLGIAVLLKRWRQQRRDREIAEELRIMNELVGKEKQKWRW